MISICFITLTDQATSGTWCKYLAFSICDADKNINRILFLKQRFQKDECKIKKIKSVKEEEIIIPPWSQTVHLSVQLFHQGDISRYGLDPKEFFRARVEGKAIPHLLALRVCAVETVNLGTWEKIANKLRPKMAALWQPLWPADGRWRRTPPSRFHPSCGQVVAAGERVRVRTYFPLNICSSIRDYLTSWTLTRWLPDEAILSISRSVCVSEVRLTHGRVLWEAEQCQVPIAAVGSVVIEIWRIVRLCWGRRVKVFFTTHFIVGALYPYS